MSKLIENTVMFNTIAETFKASDREGVKSVVITFDRGKQIADSADRYIVIRKPDTID